MSRLEVALATLLMSVPPCPSSSFTRQRDTPQDSAQSPSHSLHTWGASQATSEPAAETKWKPSKKTERNRGFYREETIILNLYKQGGDPRQVSESVAVICKQFERSCIVVAARRPTASFTSAFLSHYNHASQYSCFVYRVIPQEEIAT